MEATTSTVAEKISEIEREVKEVEKVVDEVLIDFEPQYAPATEYCFGICNVLFDLFLEWLYNVKTKTQ